MNAPVFPPLLSGRAAPAPFVKAQAEAMSGCDAGLVLYDLSPDTLSAAIIFAPDVVLERAMSMLPLCAVGFHNALGALAPPEIALHLEWSGGVRLNGASCGGLRAAASTKDAQTVPDWLVIGLEVPLWPGDQIADPGDIPNQTTLYGEGCSDIDPVTLLEAWARHTLVWLNRWEEEGGAPLHREWSGLGPAKGDAVPGYAGTFLGLDENFGLLLQQGDKTALISLTDLLEAP